MSNTTYSSDAKAVSRVLAGQTDEFAPLVERYLPVAKAAAVGRLGDATEAEDVVQESFLKAYQSLHTLRSPDKFGAWLLGIVRNTCSRAKTRRLRELSRQGKALENDVNAAPDMEAREIRELLHQEIVRLEEKQGEVLLLHYFAGKTLNEIAALLDISRSAAAKRLQRARDALGQQVLSRLEQADTEYGATKERVSGIMGAISLAQVPWKAAIPAGGILGIAGKGLWPGFLGAKVAIPALLLISAALYAVLPHAEEQEASPPKPTEPGLAAQIQNAQRAETPRDLTAANEPATSSTAVLAKIVPETSETRTVQGTVVSQNGFPRPSVELATSWPLGIYRGAESDADGVFLLKDRTPEQTHWMAYSQNTQKAALFTVGDRTDAPINVILDLDLADLVGRVVDQGNQAVFKAVVEAEVATPDGNRFRSDLIVADTHGYFDSRLIPTGDGLSLRVRVRPPGDEAPGEWSDPVQLANGLFQIEVPTIVVPDETAKNIAANQKLDGIPGCYPEILRTAKPRERLAGFIQDPAGNPVAGVHLNIVYGVPSGMVSSSVAVSGKDGSWNCLVPAGLGSVSVRTHHANYVASKMIRAKPAPSLARMRDGTSVIVMDPGLKVTGVIRGPDGLPLGDALVLSHNLYSTTPGGPGVTANAPIEDATTTRSGRDGSFSLACLPVGNHNLAVVKRGYPTKVVAVDVTYDMSPLKIDMGLGGTIHGRIVDETGEAIPKAYVYAGRWNTGNGGYSVNLGADVDQDGHFVVEHVPLDGTVEFSFGVRRDGEGRRNRSYMGMSTSTMVPREEPYEITMYHRPVFRGTVVDDETGQPITEFEVKNGWQRKGRDQIDWISMSTPSKIQSDEGHFSKELGGVQIGYPTTTLFAVGILAEGYLPATSPLLTLGEPLEPFVIRLRKGDPIRGVVADALAQPVEGAEVFWVAPGKTVYVRNGTFQQRIFIDTRTKTDNQGRFKLPASEESGHLFILHDSGYRLVEWGGPSGELALDLIPWARVEGTAYRGSETRPNATVALVSETTAHYYLNPRVTRMEPSPVQWSFDDTSHIDGNFIFDRVPAVPMFAAVRATENHTLSHLVGIHPHANEVLSIQIGGAGKTVTGSLDLTVPPYATTPFDPRWIRTIARRITGDTAENSIPPSYAAVIEEDGTFSIEDIPPGEYELEIVAYEYPQDHKRDPVELASALIQFTVPDTETDTIAIPPIQLEASDASL